MSTMRTHPLTLNEHQDRADVAPVPRLGLTLVEAAEAIGVSERTIRSWIAEEGFPAVKIGRVVVVPVDELKRWLSERASCVM